MRHQYSILIVSILCIQCSGSYSPWLEIPFVYIEFDSPACISVGQDIPLCYKITNRSDTDILINTWALEFYFDVCDTANVRMLPRYRYQQSAPLYKKFLLVKKHSTERFCTEQLAFSKYDFQIGNSYIIQAKFRNIEQAEDTVKTCVGEIGPYMHRFKICN
jgi:hypothetical protein